MLPSLLSLPAAEASRFAEFGVGPCRLVGLVGALQPGCVLPVLSLSEGGFVPRGSCAAPCRATLTG